MADARTPDAVSDRVIVAEMLDRAGVKYLTGPDTDTFIVEALDRVEGANLGYQGFVAIFYFTDDGSLRAMGAWE